MIVVTGMEAAGEVAAAVIAATRELPEGEVGTIGAEVVVPLETAPTGLLALELDGAVEAGADGTVMVVDIGTEEVTTVVERAGQFVTSAAQLVMVSSCVEYSVIVDGTAGADERAETSAADEEVAGTDAAAGVTVDGQAVIIAGLLGTYRAQIPIK